jgi:hypothetical protein
MQESAWWGSALAADSHRVGRALDSRSCYFVADHPELILIYR